MRFAIFSHVEHIEREGRYYAYAPYVREMNIWLKYVQKVEVVAPRTSKGQLTGKESYRHKNITFTRIPSFHFLSLRAAVKAVVKIPYIFFKIYAAMKRADHLHLRCPGNIGLLACICQIFFPSKSKSAKYAGNWDPEAKQPFSYRLQKWLLSNTFLTKNMQVLVYGEWPGQSKNIVSFFTASFSENKKAEVPKKAFSEPFIFLFVGNLVEGKRPLEAIKFVEKLNFKLREGKAQEICASYIPLKLELYGDGPEREKLEAYVRENDLENITIFRGNRPLKELKEAYKKSHFVILPSKSEGWPKAIAEGMFFGCFPVATPVSCVPWMLGNSSRGMLISGNTLSGSRVESGEWREESENQEPGVRSQDGKMEWTADVKKLMNLLEDPEEMKRRSEAAKNWSQQYTLERFEVAIQKLLQKQKID
jgi:glycosyltransferase involved in cell wall biosynthesis